MRPIKLTMTGFESYKDKTTINFDELGTKGLYLISGDTGAGKTTIFDAITFALYGEASGPNRENWMLNSKYAAEGTPTVVELTFLHAGKEYKVCRNTDYERPAKRGGGKTSEPADATLTMPDGQVINKLTEEYKKEHPDKLTDEQIIENIQDNYRKPPVEKRKSSGIIVQGIQDVSARFSKCCSPVPGDEIVGFVTRGRGISIHRTDCVNVINLSETEKSRLIPAEWETTDLPKDEVFVAEVRIYCHDRNGLLVDISKILTEQEISIRSINSATSKHSIVTINVSFAVSNRDQLDVLCTKIRQVIGVAFMHDIIDHADTAVDIHQVFKSGDGLIIPLPCFLIDLSPAAVQ